MNSLLDGIAVLFDHENLALSLCDVLGDDFGADSLGLEAILGEASRHGRVLVRRAYADWRYRQYNRHQTELHRYSIQLRHVLAGGKNATDLALAVEAVELVYTNPLIQHVVLVSGDSDFHYLIQVLQARGVYVTVIARRANMSSDLERVCDRFVPHDELVPVLPRDGDGEPYTLDDVVGVLASVLHDNAEHGLTGSQLKVAVGRRLGARFDEKCFGFSRFSDFVGAYPSVADVRLSPTGSDMRVFPAYGVRAAK